MAANDGPHKEAQRAVERAMLGVSLRDYNKMMKSAQELKSPTKLED